MAICKIAMEEIEHIEFYVPDNRISIANAYNNHLWNGRKCDAITNGSLFDMASNTNSTITYGAVKGKQVGYLFCNYGLVINDDNVKFGTLEQAKSLCGDLIGSAPLIVRDGKTVQEWGNRKASTQVTGKHIRTAIGISDNSLIMYVSGSEITLEELAKIMIAEGCKYAINLDGGGSTSMISDGKYIRNTSRLLGNFIMVWKKKAQKEDDKVDQVKVKCNGKEQQGFLKDGTTYVPVRFVSENLGASVEWDGKNKTVTVTQNMGR